MPDLNTQQIRFLADQVADAVYERLRRGDGLVIPECLTPRQVAKILSCSEKHLEAMRAQRVGPAYLKEGRFVRYERQEILRYLQRLRVEMVGLRGGRNQ